MIQIRQLTYQYPNQRNPILKKVNLNIQKGSTTVLTGSNGSGKTTLLKIMGGLVPKFTGGIFSGQRTWNNEEYDTIDPRKIGMILHGTDQYFIQERVDQEIFHILETNLVNQLSIQQIYDTFIQEWNLQFILQKKISDLSSGEIQVLKIALSFLFSPELILMDEPLSFLDQHWRNFVLQKCKQANKNQKTTFVIADHQIDIWKAWDENIQIMHLDESSPPVPQNTFAKSKPKTKPLLKIQDLEFTYDSNSILKGLSGSVSKGEIVGVYGANGSGKTTLLRLLKGHIQSSKGLIQYHLPHPRVRLLGLPTLQTFFSMKIRDELQLNKTSASIFHMEDHFDDFVFDLSSGEQRKVALECILSDQVDLLLLDEPFLHLDSNSKNILSEALKKISEMNVTILMTAQDENAILYACNQTWELK